MELDAEWLERGELQGGTSGLAQEPRQEAWAGSLGRKALVLDDGQEE